MSQGQVARLNTPVLFLIFCRPDTTKLVFEAIRQAKPSRLYVAADGPRDNHPEDAEKVKAARKIATAVDWECEVHTLFRETNLGCGKGPSTAITWFFTHETEGIILEDDCLPSPSFFPWCAELLERYRDDTRIMHIGGNNFERRNEREDEYSYSFSNLITSWGWATWRRAWQLHDFKMNLYEEVFHKKYMDQHFNSIYERDYFQYVFREMYQGNSRNVWDYQWQFACKIHSGLVIVPVRNLVVNLGFGKDATNTTNPRGLGHNLRSEEIEFPLRHPEFVMVNRRRDRHVFSLSNTSRISRIKSTIKQLMPKPVVEKLKLSLQYVFSFCANRSNAMERHGVSKTI